MFLLIDKANGGVYAVHVRDKGKVVQMFEEEDDAERYLGLLVANALDPNEHKQLEVVDVDQETVVKNCEMFGYNYCVITPEDIVFPP
jgi:hypothetical protein